jgi:hypothetical protein
VRVAHDTQMRPDCFSAPVERRLSCAIAFTGSTCTGSRIVPAGSMLQLHERLRSRGPKGSRRAARSPTR